MLSVFFRVQLARSAQSVSNVDATGIKPTFIQRMFTSKICQVYATMLKYCIEKGKDPRGRSFPSLARNAAWLCNLNFKQVNSSKSSPVYSMFKLIEIRRVLKTELRIMSRKHLRRFSKALWTKANIYAELERRLIKILRRFWRIIFFYHYYCYF